MFSFFKDLYHELFSEHSSLEDRMWAGMLIFVLLALLALLVFIVVLVFQPSPVKNCTPTGHSETRRVLINNVVMVGKTPVSTPTYTNKKVHLYNCPDGRQVWH